MPASGREDGLSVCSLTTLVTTRSPSPARLRASTIGSPPSSDCRARPSTASCAGTPSSASRGRPCRSSATSTPSRVASSISTPRSWVGSSAGRAIGRPVTAATTGAASAGRSSTSRSTTRPGSSPPSSWPTRRRARRRASSYGPCAGCARRGSTPAACSATTGGAYRSRVFGRVVRRLGLRHSRTRPVLAADQRQARALDPDGPLRVPLSRGLHQLRGAAPCAQPLRRLLQRGAPSPGHRRTDASAAAQREARRLTV
jgi:hypothetical protein